MTPNDGAPGWPARATARCFCGAYLGKVFEPEPGVLCFAPILVGVERMEQHARKVNGYTLFGFLSAGRTIEPPEPEDAAPIEAFCRQCSARRTFDPQSLRRSTSTVFPIK